VWKRRHSTTHFLAWALDGGEQLGLSSLPGRMTLVKAVWIAQGPKVGLDVLENRALGVLFKEEL